MAATHTTAMAAARTGGGAAALTGGAVVALELELDLKLEELLAREAMGRPADGVQKDELENLHGLKKKLTKLSIKVIEPSLTIDNNDNDYSLIILFSYPY